MAKKKEDDEQDEVISATDIEALVDNATAAVMAFAERWMPMPMFKENVEVMDQADLRDAMGLRATMAGDPWPAAEKLLLAQGFRWQWLGTSRVMFLRERDGWSADDGWDDGKEVIDN
ncbi:MAG: hypothetical protein IK144_12155 [Bacteroidaceae bacterium]|nr:hypothetical protein [Bacteroidaceae bacterium]